MRLQGINQDNESRNPQGGYRRVVVIPTRDLDLDNSTVSASDGTITLAINAAEQAVYIADEANGTFNSVGANEQTHTSTIDGKMEFPVITKEKALELDNIKDIRSVTVLVELPNCDVAVFGLDKATGCSSQIELRRALGRLKPVVSVNLGTVTGDASKAMIDFTGSQTTPILFLDTANQTLDSFIGLTTT